MFDWLLTMLLGRDIVNPKLDEHAAISHALYEPGQVIVTLNDTRRFHYLVETGEVEVVTANGGTEKILSTLKPGEYFGDAAQPNGACCIRARTRVRLLKIDRDAAKALSEVRPDLALLLKQSASPASFKA